ncbi:hypothetical protein EST38_g9575 [Candolleomyces aberdarensis]|uniref:Uncharacterized protein n=1 Tax=Candolleomyces aberdarensis TaxID=2316362 RepID=A0A4Q2DA95_9AGAR|nr:hypothetical protein EST38_g9575 [Candolleomyces aberdarensis]
MSVQASTSVAKARVLQQHNDDIVIVSAVRSAITKGKKGGLKDTKPELILSHVLRAAYEKVSLDPSSSTTSRSATSSLTAEVLPLQCSSGLTAITQIANEIKAGQIEIGIGAGVESMTNGYGAGAMASISDEVLSNPDAEDCLLPMGITSENVAASYNISRATQDAFAARSFQKAAAAQKAGKFKDEILPIKAKWVDPKTEEEKKMLVDSDDGIRAGVTQESLGKLKPAFKKDGSTHAGNASQVSDGATAVLLTKRSTAKRLGLPIRGKFVTSAVIGVPPKIIGVGPAYAIPKALGLLGLSLEDIDFYEINEAFASQAVMSVQHLGIGEEKVNINGGAIAIGHPLGCTGARQVATGLSIAKQTGGRVFVTSMCIGSGMGMAAVFVSEH